MGSTAVRGLLCLLIIACTGGATAAEVPSSLPVSAADDPAAQQLIKVLSDRYPNAKFESARPSKELPGWWEVETSTQLLYANPSGERLIVGYIVDTKTREDLTATRLSELHTVDFRSLPLTQAIKIVKGDGSRVFAAFEDPLCPFCQKLEHEIAEMNNYTLYVFLFPLEGVHPGATERAKQIWCNANRAVAWQSWMLTQTMPASNACSGDPISDNAALASRLHIVATPTLVFSDGSRVTEAIPKESIEKRLQDSAPVHTAAR